MRESRPYGSVRGARDETRVPTATLPTGGPPTLEDETSARLGGPPAERSSSFWCRESGSEFDLGYCEHP